MPLLTFSPPSVFSETFTFAVRFRLRLSDAQSEDIDRGEQTRPAVAALNVNPRNRKLSSSEDMTWRRRWFLCHLPPEPPPGDTRLLCEVKWLSSDNSSNLVILSLTNL